jgi:opacity protein-like surface antigen
VKKRGEIMSKTKTPKYFGVYYGPSYHSYDRERMMGFASKEDARRVFDGFYSGSVRYDEYIENTDGYLVPWSMNEYSLTPGTCEEDFIDVYSAYPGDTPGTYTYGSVLYRLSWGPRGGIVVENA